MNKPISQMHVVVLKGGFSSEREVSLRSGQAVADALREHAARITEVDVTTADFALPAGVDFAFLALHGEFGEDGGVQAVLEKRGVPYSGAGVETSRIGFDKVLSKKAFVSAGVITPGHEILESPTPQPGKLRVPLVVKPPCQGSSVGIEIVKDESALEKAIQGAYRYGRQALLEEFHAGRELTVGVVGGEALPIVEIRPKSGFYDYQNKYTQGASEYQVPAFLEPAQAEAVCREALKAYHSLGTDIVYGRVDVILDEKSTPWVLEVNTIPGMTATSLLPKAAAAIGIGFGDLCVRIIRESLKIRGMGKEKN
ncbi:D-alanine--D-alanine ligase [Oscillatoria amoena NRMC-F 0135]|nr:D-alanine--D-alanine ligase [Oscillatoria amoena NRMC-F 0135]